jgi:hypothetical protein
METFKDEACVLNAPHSADAQHRGRAALVSRSPFAGAACRGCHSRSTPKPSSWVKDKKMFKLLDRGHSTTATGHKAAYQERGAP